MSDKLFVPRKAVYIASSASAVGHEEKAGPLGDCFDIADTSGSDLFGEDSFEKAESRMQRLAFDEAVRRCGISPSEVDAVFAGDLLNQCASSGYAGTPYGIPMLGIYGACSTCAEGLLLASVLASSCADTAGAVTSSHNCASERQFRFPLEYGAQRPPTAQWTVTGAGAFVVTSDERIGKGADGEYAVEIADALPGIPRDYGINDANDMGAAMAPVSVKLRPYPVPKT